MAAPVVVRVGVGVAILSDEQPNRVLVGRRKGSHGAGTWALPGGHVEMGESVQTTAVREVKEETDLDLDPSSVRLVGFTQDCFDASSKHYVTLITCAKLAPTSAPLLNKEPHKCEEWIWSSLEELAARRDECFLPLQHALESFLNPGVVRDVATLADKGQVLNEL